MNDTPATPCRYPILLLHGLFGFVERRIGPVRFTYFRNVVPRLEAAGNRVFTVAVHPTQTVEYRARQIAEFIESHPLLSQSKINLIGHSMGGVDGRYLTSRLDPKRRVASLTTIASPHRGSWLADLIGTLPLIRRPAERWMPGIRGLAEASMARFNSELLNRPDVLYLSVSTATPLWSCTPLMWPLYALMWIHSGPNDGQVSNSSSQWGEVLENARADHFETIGLRLGLNLLFPFDHLALFERVTHVLAARGL